MQYNIKTLPNVGNNLETSCSIIIKTEIMIGPGRPVKSRDSFSLAIAAPYLFGE